MLTFEHRQMEIVLGLGLCLAIAAGLWRRVRAARNLARIPSRVVAVLLALLAFFLLLVDGCGALWNQTESSAPVYSPDRKHCIVVRNWTAGAFGGGEYIDLYSHGGLVEVNIGGGEWNIVDAKGIRWTSNHEVLFACDTSGYSSIPAWESTADVHVSCAPKP